MPNYLSNTMPISIVSPVGLGNAGALIYGLKWGGPLGSGVYLTFSFIMNAGLHEPQYGEGEFSDFLPLTAPEETGVESALTAWSDLACLNLSRTTDDYTAVGDIRFAISGTVGANENGHTYLPNEDPAGGDVWLSAQHWHTSRNTAVAPGTYDYLTLIHEIGHALGLKHPFEGSPTLPPAYDSFSYTVMSYSAKAGLSDNYASFYPTTPMWYDILAIEDLYGARCHNAGNDTYTFSSTGQYWQTIDDTGGIDTIAVTGSAPVLIDLRIGHWSQIGLPITFSDGSQQYGTVMMGPRTVIENARGGGGADRIIGNAANNVIIGGAGDDTMTGGGGKDRFVFGAGFGHDMITDFDATSRLHDVIAIAHDFLGSFSAVKHHASIAGGDVVIMVDAADSITLASVHHLSSLSAGDFVFT